MNGFFNLNKPVGISSAAAVGAMKRLTGEKRIGHAGTLDPEAAGVLPIMVGRATRLFDYLVDKEKEYETVCAFGTATDTQDATGTVVAEGTEFPDLARVEAEIPKLVGDIIQRPSMYSAVKVGGKRMYDLARKGETAEVPERTVHVGRIEILGEEPEHGVRMRVVCGRGTYIRSICDDLGKLCGCPAHMRSLVRTRSGVFEIGNAMTIEEARAAAEEGRLAGMLMPMDSAIGHIPRMDAEEGLAKKVAAGARLPVERLRGYVPKDGEVVRVYLLDQFWGICECRNHELFWRAQIPPENEA